MPVVKRLVEPVHCSRAPIPKGVKNELEAVSVNTLSSVILQLSSLAKHAESIFAELFTEASSIHQRSCSVQQRLEQLAVKVTKLDSAGEEISLQEINMQKAFKLTIHSDQQILSRDTLPEAMMESYAKCEPVPDLQALTVYRHDGKDALKFYTDPSYFFELWKQKMNVEVEKRRKKKKRGNRGKKREEEKKVVKGVKKKEVGKNIPAWEITGKQSSTTSFPENSHEAIDAVSPVHSHQSSDGSFQSPSPTLSPRRLSTKRFSTSSSVGRPTSAPPPPPPGGTPSKQPGVPPPPPPPPVGAEFMSNMPVSPPPPPPSMMIQSPSSPLPPNDLPPPPPMSGGPPPPPPPPPPMSAGGAPPPPPPPISNNVIQKVVLSAPRPAPEPEEDSRNGLLTAIRHGMNLRKTQQITKEEKKEKGMGNDVASILARRIAVEYSDSEDGDSDFSDDGDWSDDE